MNFTRAKSSCEPRSKLKQTKGQSAPLNKVTMRSFFDDPDSDHDAMSFEFCNVNTRTSPVCKNINNGSVANAFIEFSDSCQTNPQNGSVTILSHKNNVVTSKSRVPDILMINKYYGLIPQKFAISSRKPPGSTPSSAHGSRGATKSSSSKPRAKSSHHHRHQEGKSFEKLKGCRSDNDSPEPIKMVVIARKGSLDHTNSTIEERSSDPFGPVTKKMSVEKYKKWKHGGGGKGRNVNVRSCSIGETLSLMDKGLPDGLDSHANRASPEYLANRRVIKIDLNKVSWDEENYQITTSITDSTMPNFVGEDETAKLMPNDIIHETKPTLLCTKDNNESSFNAESERITIANNDNVYRPLRTKAEFVDNSSLVTSKDFLPEKKNMQSTATSKKSGGESTFEFSEPKNDYTTQTQRSHNHIKSKANFTPNDKSKDGLVMDEINGNCEKAYDAKKTVSTLRGKLGRTISFDEKILDGSGGSVSESLSSGRSDTSKKRPMTASTQYVNKTTTFQTPNNFNPPSKVIPWTQQNTSGGKPLTLAERRAKFQRATSIHSSSSLSLEGGDEETSEIDSSNCIKLPTNSSAYRETRKPLHVIQAPEVPTLISQINPNADEDIQIEIEKVAIMLKKMQTKNFSVSLDSGIEAEMVKTSPEPNSISLNHAQNSSLLKSSESVLMAGGTHSTLKRSESESSVASDDSNSSEEPSQMKTNSSSTATKVRGRATSDKFIDKSKELLSISGLRARQCSANNSANNSISTTNKRTSSINSSSAATTTTTNTTARRPPLRKAVSISCEQELLKTGAQRRNEVNSSVNDNGKSPRPKTAAGSHQLQRSYGTGTNRSTHNYNHRLTSNVSPFDNRASTANGSSSSSSQGSKNRKILIKKALMEINQSSVNLRRKWGTLGRPRTAPNLEKNAVHHDTVSQQHPSNPQLRRKPLKASPLPISGNGKIVAGSSGKSSSVGGKSNSEAMEGGKSEQSSPTGQPRANSEAPEENDTSQQQKQHHPGGSSKQAMFRQCFSLDESALLGFSIKSVNEGRIPLFEKWADMASGESCSTSILDDELSFLSAKKREQCLKVYEKMKKTGCAVKLDTIFRGMLTPSEYRAFMRAAENAAQEADEAEKAKNESEDQEAGENTGMTKQDAHTVDI